MQVQNASLSLGTKLLFSEVSFSINSEEHIGLIGANGAGKTSLFKSIIGQYEFDSGSMIKKNSLRIAYLAQDSEWNLEQSIEEYLEQSARLPIWYLKNLGESLGLKDISFDTRISSLSGGFRMRVQLLNIIGQEPDLMLLDEPTNFLDLENFLQTAKCSFILISHDREFLKRVAHHIIEIEDQKITKFNGNIEDYFEQKREWEELLQRQAMNQEQKRKSLEAFVDRFRAKASKAKQAQSRLKQLNKMESIEVKALPVKAKIAIPSPMHTGKEVLSIENAVVAYGDRVILKDLNLKINRGDHLGVVGFNGAGKSSLLKLIAQKIQSPVGKLEYGYMVDFAYFAQHSTEQLLENETVYQALERAAHKDILPQEIMNIAGSLLFSGSDINKKIAVLSGGEKSRVALGQILLQKKSFLILDEPTNHLDFDTVESLTQALQAYTGSLIGVSHDRSFISRLCSKILEIKNSTLNLYPGTYEEYLWSLEKGVLAHFANENSGVSTTGGSAQNSTKKFPEEANSNLVKAKSPNFKEEKKRLQSELKNLQKSYQVLEKSVETKKAEQITKTELLLLAKSQQAADLARELSQLASQIEQDENDSLQILEQIMNVEEALSELHS